jgi:hypothetical protein
MTKKFVIIIASLALAAFAVSIFIFKGDPMKRQIALTLCVLTLACCGRKTLEEKAAEAEEEACITAAQSFWRASRDYLSGKIDSTALADYSIISTSSLAFDGMTPEDIDAILDTFDFSKAAFEKTDDPNWTLYFHPKNGKDGPRQFEMFMYRDGKDWKAAGWSSQ